MRKQISPKTIALTFGILVISFLAAFYVVAWQEPSEAPPLGNVSAPLNTGPTAQTKAGALAIAAGGGDALTLRNGGDLKIYNADNSGSALLYADNNGELITPGNLKVGSVTLKGDNTISTNLNADKVDDYHAADLMAQSGGGGVLTTWGAASAFGIPPAGTNAPGCPSGWTQAYAGYGPHWAAKEYIFGGTGYGFAYGYGAVSDTCGASVQYIGAGGSTSEVSACFISSGQYSCNTCRVCVK